MRSWNQCVLDYAVPFWAAPMLGSSPSSTRGCWDGESWIAPRKSQVAGHWSSRCPGTKSLSSSARSPFVPPVWPTVAGQQQMGMHLDIAVDNLGEGPDRRTRFFELLDDAVARGAQVADHQPQQDRVVVMLDPAGHPFCLFPARD